MVKNIVGFGKKNQIGSTIILHYLLDTNINKYEIYHRTICNYWNNFVSKNWEKTNELDRLTNYFFKNLCKKNFKKDNIYYIFLIPLNHILKQIIPANFLLKLFQSCKLDGK